MREFDGEAVASNPPNARTWSRDDTVRQRAAEVRASVGDDVRSGSDHDATVTTGATRDRKRIRPRTALGTTLTDGARRGAWPALVSLALVSLVLGLLVGFGPRALAGDRYEAAALLLVRPDPVALGGTENASPEASDRFVQTQVLLLETPEVLAAAVGNGSGSGDDPALAVRQVGLTDVVELRATGESAAEAVDVANRVADYYLDQRRSAVLQRAEQEGAVLEQQLAQLRVDGSAGAGDDSTVVEAARLRSQLNQLALTAASGRSSVISRASSDTAEAVGAPLRTALFVGLLSFGLGVGLLLLRQRQKQVHWQRDDGP